MMSTDDDKSFHQRLIEGRGERMEECPFCGGTTEVWLRPQGFVDCPRCPPRPLPKRHTEIDLRTCELKSSDELERAAETRDIHDCRKEDEHRGQVGGGSRSGGKTRKPRPKRDRSRVEQDIPAFTGGGGARIVVTRKVERYATADQRVKLYMPESLRDALQVEADRRSRIDSTKWPLVRVIRSALWRHSSSVSDVKPFEHAAEEPKELQLVMYPDEVQALDECCAAWECSRGEFVRAVFVAFAAERIGE